MNEATSPWNWMWLRRSASISFTFVMSWNSSSTISARKPPPSSSRSGRSSSACSAGSGSRARVELQPGADPERAEREPEAGALEELLDPRARLALQLPRVGALEADRDVGDREDAVEVDEDRDHPLLPLAVAEHAPQQARLAVLPRRVEAHVVAADRGRRAARVVSSSRSMMSSGASGCE